MFRGLHIGMLLGTLVAAFGVGSDAVLDNGDSMCPCLSAAEIRFHNGTEEFPQGYGAGCGQHDMGIGECNMTSPPSSCTSSWCYIDRFNCAVSSSRSIYFAQLDYSFATCGYVDTFLGSPLAGRNIRVMHQTNSGGWQGTYCREQYIRNTCSGATTEFYDLLFSRADVIVESQTEFHPLVEAEASRLDIKNRFTKCFLATGMGYVDLCIADYSITQQRSELSKFIVFRELPYYLWVLIEQDTSIDLSAPFQPFTPMAWLAIAILVVLLSVSVAFVEGHVPNFRDELCEEKHYIQKIFSVWKHLFNMLTDGFMQVLAQDLPNDSRSFSGNVVELGFAFLAVVVLASYTANLANILISDRRDSSITGFHDVLDKGVPVCLHSNTLGMLRDQYPQLVAVKLESRSALFEHIIPLSQLSSKGPGSCAALIAPEEDVLTVQVASQMCNLVHVGLPVLTVTKSQPVSNDVHKRLQNLVSMNKFEFWSEAEELSQPGVPACGQAAYSEGGGRSGERGLDVHQMAGTFIISSALCVFGVLVHMVWICTPHSFRRRVNSALNITTAEGGESMAHESEGDLTNTQLLDKMNDVMRQMQDDMKKREDLEREDLERKVEELQGRILEMNMHYEAVAVAFEIEVEKRRGVPVGLDVDHRVVQRLKITQIKAGLISEWNVEHPDLKVIPGDSITEINGVAGNAHKLLAAVGQSTKLKMTIQRGEMEKAHRSLGRSLLEVEEALSQAHAENEQLQEDLRNAHAQETQEEDIPPGASKKIEDEKQFWRAKFLDPQAKLSAYLKAARDGDSSTSPSTALNYSSLLPVPSALDLSDGNVISQSSL